MDGFSNILNISCHTLLACIVFDYCCSNYYFCPSLWLKISHFDFFSSFNIKWLNIVFLISVLYVPLSSWTCDLLFSLILESSWFSFSIPMMYILHILVIVPLFLNFFCLFKILWGKKKLNFSLGICYWPIFKFTDSFLAISSLLIYLSKVFFISVTLFLILS